MAEELIKQEPQKLGFLSNRIHPMAQYNLSQYANSNASIKNVVTHEFAAEEPLYSYSTRRKITIPLETDKMLDGLNSYLAFKIQFNGTNPGLSFKRGPAATGSLGVGAHVIFNRLTVKSEGDHIVEEIQNFNHLYTILNCLTMDREYASRASGRFCGMGTDAELVADGVSMLAEPTQFIMRFHPSGVLFNRKMIPLGLCKLTIELELEDPLDCMVNGSANDGSYTVTDVVYCATLYEMSDAYNRALMSASMNTLTIPFHTWGYRQKTIDGNSLVMDVMENKLAIKACLFVIRDELFDDKYHANPYTYIHGNLNRWQFDDGNIKIPYSYVAYRERPASDWSETEKAIGFHADISNQSLITRNNFQKVVETTAGAVTVANWRTRQGLSGATGGFTAAAARDLDGTTRAIHGMAFERDGGFFSSTLEYTKKLKLYCDFDQASNTYQLADSKRYISAFVHYDAIFMLKTDGRMARTEVKS